MSTNQPTAPSRGEDFPVDDPTVAFYTQHTGPRMTANMRGVFRELGRYADLKTGVSSPSQGTIADALDMHRTTVRGAATELVHLGLLVERPKQDVGGKQAEYVFTAAASWLPTAKNDMEKGQVVAAYRQLVAELRSQLEDSQKENAGLESRVAQLEGSISSHRSRDATEDRTFDEPDSEDEQDADHAAPVAAPGIQERDPVNVGSVTDIDPQSKSRLPVATSENPDPESHHPGDSDDDQEMERDLDHAGRESPVPESHAESGPQAGPFEYATGREQLAFALLSPASSNERGRDIPAGGLPSDEYEPQLDHGGSPDASRAPLPVPVDLVAEPAIDGSITLSWHVEVDDRVTGYQIVRKCLRGADTERVIRDVEGQLETEFLDSDVARGPCTYIYMVCSKGAGEVSDLSRHLTVTGVG